MRLWLIGILFLTSTHSVQAGATPCLITDTTNLNSIRNEYRVFYFSKSFQNQHAPNALNDHTFQITANDRWNHCVDRGPRIHTVVLRDWLTETLKDSSIQIYEPGLIQLENRKSGRIQSLVFEELHGQCAPLRRRIRFRGETWWPKPRDRRRVQLKVCRLPGADRRDRYLITGLHDPD